MAGVLLLTVGIGYVMMRRRTGQGARDFLRMQFGMNHAQSFEERIAILRRRID